MANMRPTTLRVAMQRPSLRHRNRTRYSEGSGKRWKYPVPQRKEEATLQPPQLVLHPMTTVPIKTTLPPHGNCPSYSQQTVDP